MFDSGTGPTACLGCGQIWHQGHVCITAGRVTATTFTTGGSSTFRWTEHFYTWPEALAFALNCGGKSKPRIEAVRDLLPGERFPRWRVVYEPRLQIINGAA